jgi:hypothetical protein
VSLYPLPPSRPAGGMPIGRAQNIYDAKGNSLGKHVFDAVTGELLCYVPPDLEDPAAVAAVATAQQRQERADALAADPEARSLFEQQQAVRRRMGIETPAEELPAGEVSAGQFYHYEGSYSPYWRGLRFEEIEKRDDYKKAVHLLESIGCVTAGQLVLIAGPKRVRGVINWVNKLIAAGQSPKTSRAAWVADVLRNKHWGGR